MVTIPPINHPLNHHFYRWYGYHSQSWEVYDIVLPTPGINLITILTTINH